MGIHTQPSSAYDEINALVGVYEEAVHHYGNVNGIILGDFNSDCSYLSQRRYDMLVLVTDSRFTWLLDNDVDTTTGNSTCAYDKCVWCVVCGVCGCICVLQLHSSLEITNHITVDYLGLLLEITRDYWGLLEITGDY